MRGFDRDQVIEHLHRVDAEMRLLAADRDAATANAHELAAHLESARDEIAELRSEVDRLSVPPTTAAGMSERLGRMLQLAADEASEMRADASAESDEVRSIARQDAAQMRQEAESDAARMRREAQEDSTRELSEADAESTRLRTEASEAADKMINEATALAAEIEETARREARDARDTAERIALARLARSRQLVHSADGVRTQIIDQIAEIRGKLDELPEKLALAGDDELLAATDIGDAELISRTLDPEARLETD